MTRKGSNNWRKKKEPTSTNITDRFSKAELAEIKARITGQHPSTKTAKKPATTDKLKTAFNNNPWFDEHRKLIEKVSGGKVTVDGIEGHSSNAGKEKGFWVKLIENGKTVEVALSSNGARFEVVSNQENISTAMQKVLDALKATTTQPQNDKKEALDLYKGRYNLTGDSAEYLYKNPWVLDFLDTLYKTENCWNILPHKLEAQFDHSGAEQEGVAFLQLVEKGNENHIVTLRIREDRAKIDLYSNLYNETEQMQRAVDALELEGTTPKTMEQYLNKWGTELDDNISFKDTPHLESLAWAVASASPQGQLSIASIKSAPMEANADHVITLHNKPYNSKIVVKVMPDGDIEYYKPVPTSFLQTVKAMDAVTAERGEARQNAQNKKALSAQDSSVEERIQRLELPERDHNYLRENTFLITAIEEFNSLGKGNGFTVTRIKGLEHECLDQRKFVLVVQPSQTSETDGIKQDVYKTGSIVIGPDTCRLSGLPLFGLEKGQMEVIIKTFIKKYNSETPPHRPPKQETIKEELKHDQI